MAKYTTISEENAFDVAIKLFGQINEGLKQVLSEFRDINNPVPFNQDLTYTEIPNESKFIVPIPVKKQTVFTFGSRESQSPYDLAVQLSGDLTGLRNVIEQVGLPPVVASFTSIRYSPLNTYNVRMLFGVVISTGTINDIVAQLTNFRIIHDGGFRIIHDGGLREVTTV